MHGQSKWKRTVGFVSGVSVEGFTVSFSVSYAADLHAGGPTAQRLPGIIQLFLAGSN
jgi:hypothetical protein